jgi:aryl-alcohol dehydrogenase-like predicted oxidoreductase
MKARGLDDYVTLGRSGLQVSPICLGAMMFGQKLGWGTTDEESKFCGNMFPADPNGGGAGRKSLVAACHESLRRLQTEYIDLYWMHARDPNTPIHETVRALDDLVRAAWLEGALGEKTYAVVDELICICGEAGTTPAAVDLAWVLGRPGVTSTLIGARTTQQLEPNLGALTVTRSVAQVHRIDVSIRA